VWLRERRRHRLAQAAAAQFAPSSRSTDAVLVAYASQTGSAEQWAWQTAQSLHTAGMPARVLALNEVDAAMLLASQRMLFIVSTYGEGDPPDSATLFAQRVMPLMPDLSTLHCGVLALGDSEYQHFCGFGRTLDAWLAERGAKPLFERIDVDRGNEDALRHWRHEVGRVAGTGDLPDWEGPRYQPWQLAARRHLNPGSAGEPAYLVELRPPSDMPDAAWEAGDLVQVLAPADAQRPREYSIASLASDGCVQLLVRQQRHADGTLGVASGWLTREAPLHGSVDLRLRPHRAFRIEGNRQRPLILIGNGTGLAGLRSHLKARAAMKAGPNWLLFGERQAAHDFFFEDEIRAWLADGTLARADFAFSRDQPERVYVQHRLMEAAETVREWVADGAAVYVCGSLEGMAAAVDAALQEVVGASALQTLVEEGRYRRDVY
jgi:sulfite reductase (NADPH) flavoprotein alpha-component